MFGIAAIIRPDDDPYPMYPIPGSQNDTVCPEPDDGTSPLTLIATEVEVAYSRAGKLKYLSYYRDIRAAVQVTDNRVTVACSKYEKGGGWYGDPFSMIALNAGSKLLAAARRRNKMLTAQVRYPWLSDVGFKEKRGFGSDEGLRLCLTTRTDEGEPMGLFLDLTLRKNHSARQAAAEIIRRSASYRISHDKEFDEGELVKWQRLLNPPPIAYEKGSYAIQALPSSFKAVASTAGVPENAPQPVVVPTPALVPAVPPRQPPRAVAAPVDSPTPAARPANRACRTCSVPAEPAARFCGGCGSRLP